MWEGYFVVKNIKRKGFIMYIKEQLIYGENPITQYLPEIDEKDLYGIMFLISNLGTKFLRHRRDYRCMSLDQQLRYSLFTQYNWRNNINNKEHPFNKLFIKEIKGNSKEHITNGYRPSGLLLNAYVQWAKNNVFYDLIEVGKEKKIMTKCKELNNYDYEDNDNTVKFTEEIDIDILHIEDEFKRLFNELIPIEIQENKNLTQEDCANFTQEDCAKILYILIPLHRFYNSIVKNNNKLKIQYKQVTSGRYYSTGEYSIHSLKREARKIILNDYNEYDISVSAPLLLSQIYKEITGEKVPSTIKDFIINKKMIREIFAQKYGISLDKSKEFFTSLFFGSRLLSNDNTGRSAATVSLGKKIVNSILLDKTSYEYLLYKDIHKLFDVISNHYRKIDKTKVVGYNGHTLKLNEWKKSSVVAHLYQSLESKVLDSMIKFYTTKTNDYNYVRVHDCLYTKKEIDTAELYQFIKKETGIDTLFVNPERKQLPDDELYKMMNFSSLKKK